MILTVSRTLLMVAASVGGGLAGLGSESRSDQGSDTAMSVFCIPPGGCWSQT